MVYQRSQSGLSAGASVATYGAATTAALASNPAPLIHRPARVPGMQKAPWGDLYEVVVRSADGSLLYYVDSQAKVIIAGQVFDAESGRNLTGERQRRLLEQASPAGR